MKPTTLSIGAGLLACCAAPLAHARPQNNEVTVTAVVSAISADPPADKPGSEAEVQDATKAVEKRQAVRLRFNNQPIIMLRRVNLNQDGAEVSEETPHNVEVTVEAHPPKIWLGIGLKEIEGDLAKYLGTSEGVFVEEVIPHSPAASSKLAVGDIIVAIDDAKVAVPSALIAALHELSEKSQPADLAELAADEAKKEKTAKDKPAKVYPPVTLKILRRGQQMDVQVTPADRQGTMEVTAHVKGEDWKEGADILQFGTPTKLNLNMVNPTSQSQSSSVIVMKENDEVIEVQIKKSGDGPTVIKVKDAKGEREVKEEELKELPPKVQAAIGQILKSTTTKKQKAADEKAPETNEIDVTEKTNEAVQQQLEKALKKVHGVQIQIGAEGIDAALKGVGLEGKVIVLKGAKADVGQAAEMLEEIHKKIAEVTGQQKTGFSNMPEQVKELRDQVQQLKMQVEELKEQIKASK